MAAERLRFAPRFAVERVAGVGVFLVSEDGASVLSQPVHLALAPLLDCRRTADEAVDALDGSFSALEVYHAIETMTAKGYVVRAGPEPAPEEALAYWGLAGIEEVTAVERLETMTVDPVALDGISHDALTQALGAAGLSLAHPPAADLTLVAVADYLTPALADIDERHRADGRPWMLVRPVGATFWLGPLFVPGETACWHCLAQRVEGNRAVETFLAGRRDTQVGRGGRAEDPAVITAALALAAQQVRNVVAGIADAPLRDTVVTVDSRTLTAVRHPVVRRPQCAACGDPGLVTRRGLQTPVLRTRASVSPDLHRAESIDATLQRMSRHVSPVTGAVRSVDRVFDDQEGVLHAYTAGHNFAVQYDGLAFLRRSLRMRSGGKGRTETEARVGAICEALERYCGVYRGDEPSVRGSYAELAAEAIHPNAVTGYSDRQYADRQALNEASRRHTSASQLVTRPLDPDAHVDWTPVWSPVDGSRRLLPTGMCYFNHASYHGYRSAGELFFLADSNGHAAGTSFEDAALQGLLELIERDAVGIWWYNRLQRPQIDLTTMDDPYVAQLVDRLDRLGRDVWVIDLTNDIGVPVACAVSRRRGEDEELVFGFGAHLDPEAAVNRALVELVQFLASFERWGDDRENRYVAFDEAATSWWTTARLEEQSYLAPAPGPPRVLGDLPARCDPDLLVELTTCIDAVGAVGSSVYLLDQTRPDIGLPVVKAIAPGLRHMWSRLGPGRLYDVPVQLGWLDRPTPEADLNRWAVFF